MFPTGQHTEAVVQREPRLLLRLAAEVGNMCLPCGAGSSGMKAAGLKEPLKEADALHCEKSGEVIEEVETPAWNGFWREAKARH